jgi:fatty-acyl-CoA synthase
MPLFHGNALLANLLPGLTKGASIALRPRFSASEFLADVRRHGCTYFNYVGRALSYVLATPEQPDDRDNPLRWGLGSEASPRDLVEFQRRFGCLVVEGYGSSENAVVIQPVPDMPSGALGRPREGLDVAIIDPETGEERPPAVFDDAGRLLNAGEAIGEIVGRNSLSSFEGYYANPEADQERGRNGWYWSGDLGYRDADGIFFFAGRTADWLRVDGENFSATPVERILGRFPGVAAVVVYAVPDPRTADQVMAAIELDPGVTFDPTAFASFLAEQPDLGTKWAPRFVRVVSRLPLTATRKIDRKPLRSERWSTTDPVWWRSRGDEPNRLLTDDDVAALHDGFRENGRESVLA